MAPNGDSSFMELLEEHAADAPGFKGQDQRVEQREFDGDDRRGPRVAREEGFGKRIKWAVGAIAGLAALLTALSTLGDYMPEMKAHAEEAHAAINRKLDEHDGRLKGVEDRLGSIDRTGARTLVLQLRATIRGLQADLRAMAPAAAGRAALEAQLDQAQLELEENNRALLAPK